MNSNLAYQQLSDGAPTARDTGPLSLPTDTRHLRLWVDALPRANPAQTQRQLGDALNELAAVRLASGVRLSMLELLRPVLLEISAALARQLQGVSLPLPAGKARAMQQVIDFEQRVADGYRLATVELCAPAGRTPFLRSGRVALAIERSIHHRARSMQHACSVYQAPAAGSWWQLHRLFAFAAAHRLDTRPVTEPAEGGPVSIRQLYSQALLLALSNPYRFSQREQLELWPLSRDIAGLLKLERSGRTDADDRFAIPLDRDEGPGYIAEERADPTAGPDGEMVWLDLHALRQTIDTQLEHAGSGSVQLRIGSRVVDASVELLRRLRAGWGRAAVRTHLRLPAGHQLDTVFGLTVLHFHLAGEEDFESFLRRTGVPATAGERDRHDRAHSAVDLRRIPVLHADVLDQSLGGYRVRWPAGQPIKARVGEMVGLSMREAIDGRRWMLGTIRWLRYEHDGSVDAGIELLARRARAAAVRSLDAGAADRPRLRAIEFEPVRDSTEQTFQLAVPALLESVSGDVELVRASHDADMDVEQPMVEQCRNTQVIEHAGDYLLVLAERAGARG